MKQVTGAAASSKRMSIECMPFLLWRFSNDAWKFDDDPVSALANNADMFLWSRVCVCVCKRTCMYMCVFFPFVRVRQCVLFEGSFRRCRSSVFWWKWPRLSCVRVGFCFGCRLLLPPRCCVRALCWIFRSAFGFSAVGEGVQEIVKIHNEDDWHNNATQMTHGGL